MFMITSIKKYTKMNVNDRTENSLIQFYKVKVIHGAAGLAVVETIEASVSVLDFLGAIVERGGCVLCRSDDYRHLRCQDSTIDSLDALGCYSEDF